jgi:hypothetical protein
MFRILIFLSPTFLRPPSLVFRLRLLRTSLAFLIRIPIPLRNGRERSTMVDLFLRETRKEDAAKTSLTRTK